MANCNCSMQENSSGFSTSGIPALLTEESAARLLTVPAKTLRNWRCVGRGPRFLRLGGGRNGCVRYEIAAIRDYLTQRTLSNSGQTADSPVEG